LQLSKENDGLFGNRVEGKISGVDSTPQGGGDEKRWLEGKSILEGDTLRTTYRRQGWIMVIVCLVVGMMSTLCGSDDMDGWRHSSEFFGKLRGVFKKI